MITTIVGIWLIGIVYMIVGWKRIDSYVLPYDFLPGMVAFLVGWLIISFIWLI